MKVIKALRSQRPVRPRRCLCCFTICDVYKSGIEDDRLLKKGDEKIAKELDIVTFVRQQMMTQIALKRLFTKFEYFLLKRQRKFVLDTAESESSGDNHYQTKSAIEANLETDKTQ